MSAVRTILANPCYLGYHISGRTKKADILLDPDSPALGHVTRQMWQERSEWVTASVQTYDSIVDETTWHEVAGLIAANARTKAVTPATHRTRSGVRRAEPSRYDAVVADAVDARGSFAVLLTPAFTRQFLDCCTRATFSAIQVSGGSSGVAEVEAEATSLWHRDGAAGQPNFYVTSVTEAKAERAIRPEAIALGVFGIIAGLAALLIAGQAVGRQLRLRADDLPVLRALGSSRCMIAAEGLIGIGASVVIGALLAVAVAIALSHWRPSVWCDRCIQTRGSPLTGRSLSWGSPSWPSPWVGSP